MAGKEDERTKTNGAGGNVTVKIPMKTILLVVGALLAGGGMTAGGRTLLGSAPAPTVADTAIKAADAKADNALAGVTAANAQIVDLKVAVGKIETSVVNQAKVVDTLAENVNRVLLGRGGRARNRENP